jgi:predicted CopG family antitoxin
MTDRKHISMDEAVFERLESHKAEDESWSEFAERVADSLETDGRDDKNRVETLTTEHIPEIAAAAGRDVEDRMTRR